MPEVGPTPLRAQCTAGSNFLCRFVHLPSWGTQQRRNQHAHTPPFHTARSSRREGWGWVCKRTFPGNGSTLDFSHCEGIVSVSDIHTSFTSTPSTCTWIRPRYYMHCSTHSFDILPRKAFFGKAFFSSPVPCIRYPEFRRRNPTACTLRYCTREGNRTPDPA